MKKTIALWVCVILLALLVGCGKTDPASAPPLPSTIVKDETTEEITVGEMLENLERLEELDTQAEEEPEVEVASVIKPNAGKQKFIKASDFSDGVAWVQYEEDYQTITAVIDTNGDIVFIPPEPVLHFSNFVDGYSFYITSYADSRDPQSHIIGKDGVSIAVDYNIYAHGGGHFLVAEHVSNFDVDEWRIGTIDAGGAIINPLRNHTLEAQGSSVTFGRAEFTYGNFAAMDMARFQHWGEGVFWIDTTRGNWIFIYSAPVDVCRTQRRGNYSSRFSNYSRVVNGQVMAEMSSRYNLAIQLMDINLNNIPDKISRSREFHKGYVNYGVQVSAWGGFSVPQEPIWSEGLIYFDHG